MEHSRKTRKASQKIQPFFSLIDLDFIALGVEPMVIGEGTMS